MRRRSLLLAASLWALAACTNGQSPQKERAQPAMEKKKATEKNDKRYAWATSNCTGIDRLEKLLGITTPNALEMLGEPASRERFRIGERDDEFHVILRNTYPASKPANNQVAVQEWSWLEGQCKLTVWFHEKDGEWRSFENSRYSATADF